VLGPLDEHQVAVTRATDALVAYGFSRNLHCRSATGLKVTGSRGL
jgi:hypothetical protein